MDAAEYLPEARGAIDIFQLEPERITVAGWLVHPEHPIDRVRVAVDGQSLGAFEIHQRPDVAASLKGVRHAESSGFRAQADIRVQDRSIHSVEVIGTLGSREEIAFVSDRLGAQYRPVVPKPELIYRVSGNRDPQLFLETGLRLARQMVGHIRRHLPDDGPRPTRLLDWGCGCGRMTQFLPELMPGIALSGCDIDAEAIGWLSQQLPAASFATNGLCPPLPFPDDSFDVVTAVSVMTHLTPRLQLRWLKEIRRVLRPGGLFAVSIHGSHAAAITLRRYWRWLLPIVGITAAGRERTLQGVAPRRYYRGTFQTLDYTRKRWGEIFEFRGVAEAGLDGYQDILLLRKPALPRP